MTFFKTRKARKELKELLHHAKHVRHMHEDIADPELLALLSATEDSAKAARKSGQGMAAAGNALEKICLKVAPPRKRAKTRENIEVFFVSIAAAMAIRAYFFQPFKIPTGSMQPTLYGITEKETATLDSKNPLATVVNMVFFGERHLEVRAKADGHIRTTLGYDGTEKLYYQPNPDDTITIYIGGVAHKIPIKLVQYCRFGEEIRAGESIVQRVVKSGDYILVNRLKYNFIRPKRGDITVFDTRDLTHPQVRNNAYYIKRMVGLPGETISVAPPHLLVNGENATDPRFAKIFTNQDYSGYQFGSSDSRPLPLIGKPGDSIVLAKDEYLFFGDNTNQSLDGRYFGAVKRKRILGPAFFVCWPLDRAGFAEISH
ncbi:MAG: signal peptidase I [Verrucomicrobia bacterium]|nr:signal peptidase I [Verrucomicrobiota bacterium]